MKLKKFLLTVMSVFFVLTLTSIFAFAADSDFTDTFVFYTSAEDEKMPIKLEKGRDGKFYLFLPAAANYSDMHFEYDTEKYSTLSMHSDNLNVDIKNGESFDFTPFIKKDASEHPVSLHATDADGLNVFDITVMKSANLRTIYFTSDDPVKYGRSYVDKSKDNTKASGKAQIIGADGSLDYSGVVSQIKGRGNTTFTSFPKKPYQLKLDKKAELIDGAGKSKKWVLLANAADPTLIRNSLALNAGAELNLDFNCHFESVDLYYDGEYRGSYQLTEKVEVGDNRVEISNTDDLVEEANIDNPSFDEPVSKTVSRLNGGNDTVKAGSAGSFKYIDGVNEPALPEGSSHFAYLLEFEQPRRYPDEIAGFITDRGQHIVAKCPEVMTKEQGLYISNYWQEFEDAIYSPNGYNEATGKYYYDYCDLESLAKCYAINEFVKNPDYYFSSTYFHLDSNTDKFFCGPLWDYDIAFGTCYTADRGAVETLPQYFHSSTYAFAKALLNIDSFRNEVRKLSSEGGEVYNVVKAMYGENGRVTEYSELVSESQKMNYKIWDITNKANPSVVQPSDITFEKAVANLESFIETRFDWLTGQISEWTDSMFVIVEKPEDFKFFGVYKSICELLSEFIKCIKRFNQVFFRFAL